MEGFILLFHSVYNSSMVVAFLHITLHLVIVQGISNRKEALFFMRCEADVQPRMKRPN